MTEWVNYTGEFNVEAFLGTSLKGDRSSPSHEKSRELRKLESDFPGVQEDEKVRALFLNPATGVVKAISLAANKVRYPNQTYLLGGQIDYEFDVIRISAGGKRPGQAAVNRRFFSRAGDIRIVN